MEAKFRAMPRGAHAVDLFRYYHLYVEGGVFLDSDTMLKAPLESITAGVDFFTARSGFLPGSIFNGFIGCTPGHPLIRMALQDAYDVDLEELARSYHLLCIHLYDILVEHGHKYSVRLYDEVMLSNGMCEILDADDRIVLTHYFANKIVPRRVADSRARAAPPPEDDPQKVLARLFALARAGKLEPEVRALAIEKIRESGNQGLLDAFIAEGAKAA